MFLTPEEYEMCEGKHGPGIEKAMKLLVQMGELFGAKRMTVVDNCHILMNDPIEWVREITEGVTKIRAFTTMHPLNPCQHWEEMGIPESAVKERLKQGEERNKIYTGIGMLPIWSCTPYFVGSLLYPGAIFSWSGSSGIIVGNSVFAARGNRDASVMSIASAITGRTPEMLLHKKENRYGQFLVELENLDLEVLTEAEYGAIGYYIGAQAGSKNVVISGMRHKLSFDNLKYLLSPMQVSGAVSLCHIVGLTPEAPTLKAALGGKKPEMKITLGRNQIEEARSSLNTVQATAVEVVVLGCPHFSIREIRGIAQLLDGKKIADNVRFWIATAEAVYNVSKQAGYVDIIENAGGRFITGCCAGPEVARLARASGIKVIATNSARAAHYIARVAYPVSSVLFGSTQECVNAGVTGKWRA